MKADRLYVYCITELNESKWGKKRNYGEEISFGKIGIEEEEVTTVSFNDIAALVSKTDIDQFDEYGEELLTQYIARHQQVIEFVMPVYPVIPMKFGTAAENKGELLELLDGAYIQFKTAFNRFRDNVELAVQVFWDEKIELPKIVANNSKIQEFMSQYAKSGNGDVQAQIAVGKAIHDVVSKKHELVTTDIQNYLLPYAVDFTYNKLIADDMIMNWAFLVEKDRESEFDAKVNEISDKYEDEYWFKYIGPMPPYSFVNIELTMPKFELIDRARRILGLAEEASMSEIKDAYRKLAAKYHPDKSPRRHLENRKKFPEATDVQVKHPDEDGEMFKKIAEAYEILELYCENYKYSFRKEQVEETIFVSGDSTDYSS
jgi:hypothetical protein